MEVDNNTQIPTNSKEDFLGMYVEVREGWNAAERRKLKSSMHGKARNATELWNGKWKANKL